MKLHVMSDIHNEFQEHTIPQTDADIIILAGDIDVGVTALYWLDNHELDKPVLYIPGNHEYYHHSIYFTESMENIAKNYLFRSRYVKVLNNNVFYQDHVRFICATLWTDFELYGAGEAWFCKKIANEMMSDFHEITIQPSSPYTRRKSFKADDALALHLFSRKFIETELNKPFAGKSVVVTHHLPSMRSVPERFKNDKLSAAFASNLDDLAAKADLWIHGHTHDSFDYMIGDCRVICNPRGYAPKETNPNFNPELLIDV